MAAAKVARLVPDGKRIQADLKANGLTDRQARAAQRKLDLEQNDVVFIDPDGKPGPGPSSPSIIDV